MTKSKKTSESEKPMKKPVWLKHTEDEVKAIIQKLANKGLTAEKIGLVLRDQYGIPKVSLYGLRIKKVLQEKNMYKEPTTLNLQKKVEKIIKHNKKNRGDQKAKRSFIISQAKLKKSEDYQKRK